MSAPAIPDFRAALTRTLVPVVVAAVVTSVGSTLRLFGIDDTAVSLVVSGILSVLVTMAYYAAVRALEWFKSSQWGWLLGYAKMPLYVSSDVAAIIDAGPEFVDDDDLDPDEIDTDLIEVDTPGQHAAPDTAA